MSRPPRKIVPSDYDISWPGHTPDVSPATSRSPSPSSFEDWSDPERCASVLDGADCPKLDETYPGWRRYLGKDILEIWATAQTIELSQDAIINYIRKQKRKKKSETVVRTAHRARSSYLDKSEPVVTTPNPNWRQDKADLALDLGTMEKQRKYDGVISVEGVSNKPRQTIALQNIRRRPSKYGPQPSEDVAAYSYQETINNTTRASTSSLWSERASRTRLSSTQLTPTRWEQAIDSTTASGFSRLPSARVADPRSSGFPLASATSTEEAEDGKGKSEVGTEMGEVEAEETLRKFRKTKIGRREIPEGMLKAINEGHKAEKNVGSP